MGAAESTVHEVRLPDGRTLAGRSWGPDRGRPVLLVAGAGTGSALAFGEDLLSARGVRLLTMDRPGMGGSTPHPQRDAASTARDYAAFAAGVLRREAPLPVVTSSQGALFGLALAATGRASSLVLVSPADEVAHPAIAPLLPEHARDLARLAATDPQGARVVLGHVTAATMEAMVREGAAAEDRTVYDDPAFLARYRAALGEGFAGDGAGYVTDTLLAMRPWGVDLSAVRVPTTLLVGALDRVHSPDLGRTLASRLPAATRSLVPGFGGALLWARPGLVLDHALGTSSRRPADAPSDVLGPDAVARTLHADTWQVHGRIRAGRGGAAARLPGARLMASGLPQAQWNNADVLDPDRVDMAAVRDWYAVRGVPWGVRVPAGTAWPHGRHLFRKRLMLLEADRFVPAPAVPGLRVRHATTADVDAVLAIDVAAFGGHPAASRAWLDPLLGAPEVSVALAELGDEPVGTAYVMRSDGSAGPAAGLGGVGVVPSARRRGVAAAVCSWLLAGALAGGARVAHTEPDTDGAARGYARLGFSEVAALDVYVDLG